MSKDLLDQVIPTEFKKYSLEMFLTELEKEISANQQAQIELMKSKFDSKANLCMQLMMNTQTKVCKLNEDGAFDVYNYFQ